MKITQIRNATIVIEYANKKFLIDRVHDIPVHTAHALVSFNKVGLHLLEKHTQHCVSDAIKDGSGEEAIQELIEMFKRFSKSQ